ncbi:hypothetical protein [Hyphomicrobium sp.]|jgi:hypothetical protein|uniref:hypothetical protein n=1 Tax=Hyphomicrobium sp. TaxID=82 RepID=UPI0035659324
MHDRPLKTGGVGYYWQPPPRDVKKGFKIASMALGGDYAAAQARANELNTALAAFRLGISTSEELVGEKTGTIKWLFDRYFETTAFKALRERTKQGYELVINRTLKLKSKEGRPLAEYRLKALTPLAADRIYQRMLEGADGGEAVRVANYSITVIKRAWKLVRRQYRQEFPIENPWTDLEPRKKYKSKKAASRAQAYALSAAIKESGHPHLGVVPLICYEWHQRPENVLAGSFKWSDWRPEERPTAVRIEHTKTGEEVWMPLEDKVDGKVVLLFPEIEAYLAELEKIGDVVVVTPGVRGARHPYSHEYACRRAKEARIAAKLPAYVNFDTCRHGGMTELGDADATEAQIMAASGHRSPEAARKYIKRTERQRLAAVRKRRAMMDSLDVDGDE